MTAEASRSQVMTALQGIISSMTWSPAINGATTWLNQPIALRLKLWGDVDKSIQPWAALVTHREIDEYRGLGLLRRRLELLVYCYCRTDDITVNGQTYLDTWMASFEQAFAPDSPSINQLTLGGTVYWVRIEGRVFKDPGDIDNQAMMILPITVEMP